MYMFSPARPRSFVCLSVSLCARLLKHACMDLDELLRVDRCRDMDELINFLLSPIRIIVRIQKPDFGIIAGYLKKLWTDFGEILWVDSCGGLHDLVTV